MNDYELKLEILAWPDSVNVETVEGDKMIYRIYSLRAWLLIRDLFYKEHQIYTVLFNPQWIREGIWPL